MATSSDMLPPSEVAAGGYDQERRARLQNHTLTQEELKVLQECNRESFLYRALPLGLGAAVAVQYGTKMGYLTPHPKYGPYMKMIGAGFIGWMVGKFSYRRQCEEKLMKLPNSVIGEALRRKHGMSSPDSFLGSPVGQFTDYVSGQDRDLGTLSSQSLDLRSRGSPQGLDDNQRPSMDRSRSHTASQGLDDRQRPSMDSMSSTSPQGLNDSERPSMDNPNLAKVPENLPPAKFSTSYEELRRQNREEYERRFSTTPPSSSQQPAPSYQGLPERQEREYPLRQSTPGSALGSGGGKKNKYGDAWEE